jgi:hypothetical protein
MHCWSYFLLCFVRIALTLLPQTGYIHPDEYFQSTEILAGEFAAFYLFQCNDIHNQLLRPTVF